MKGLYQVTAQKGKKIISSEVYGDSGDKDSLFARLMNRHKIVHSQRPLFKVIEIKLNKDMTKSSFKFRDYQRTIISQGVGVLKAKRFLYLAMEVRTGKTLTSLGIADEMRVGNVLFLTKKKAISTIESDYAT
jgi:superfamily II DNA or RNA helicase